jgi:hypothetical protein
MNKPIRWRKVAAVVFSATMVVGYVVFRTAYAQEGGAESRVLPSSKSGRVVPRQRAAQPQDGPASGRGSPTPIATSRPFQLSPASTQITIQTSGPAALPAGSVLPGSKSAAVILPSDVKVVFNDGSGATTQPTGVPGAQPAAVPTTQFSLEPQQRQHR